MRQCCPGNILDGIRTYSIIKRDLLVGDPFRTWQDFSASCNYYGLGFLAIVLVTGSLSHVASQLSWCTAGDHHYSAHDFRQHDT
jgi:hypothetical protein